MDFNIFDDFDNSNQTTEDDEKIIIERVFTLDETQEAIPKLFAEVIAKSSTYLFNNLIIDNKHVEFDYKSCVKDILVHGVIDWRITEYSIKLNADVSNIASISQIENLVKKHNLLGINPDCYSEVTDKGELSCVYTGELSVKNIKDIYDYMYINTDTLIHNLNLTICGLDDILLKVAGYDLYSVDIKYPHRSLDIIGAMNVNTDMGLYNFNYCKVPIFSEGYNSFDFTDRLLDDNINVFKINYVDYNDILIIINKNYIQSLNITNKIDHSLVDNEAIIKRDVVYRDEVRLSLNKPNYIGINGVYTGVKNDEYLIGRIVGDKILPVTDNTPQDLVIIHICDRLPEDRKFICEL